MRIPVSITCAGAFLGVFGYVYRLLSGAKIWSSRSRPHDGTSYWIVSDFENRWFCCTYFTSGLAASLWARAAEMCAGKPRRPLLYVRVTVPPYCLVRAAALVLTADAFTAESLRTT